MLYGLGRYGAAAWATQPDLCSVVVGGLFWSGADISLACV